MDFYTKEEEEELIAQLKLGYSVKKLAEKYSDKWRRSYVGMLGKLYKLFASIQEEKSQCPPPPVEKKEKKPFRFYTCEDIERLRSELIIHDMNVDVVAEIYSKKWDRPYASLKSKIISIKKDMDSQPKSKSKEPVPVEPQPAKEKVIKEKTEGIRMPEGMIFEGWTKRVTIHPDHFRIYF